MRGGYLHNHILLDPIQQHFDKLGATTAREHRVQFDSFTGFIDLFIQLQGHRIACEAELTPDRLHRDLLKARHSEATLLLIVVPQRRIAQRIQRAVHRLHVPLPAAAVWVLPLGPALARLRSCFPLIPTVNAERKANTAIPGAPTDMETS